MPAKNRLIHFDKQDLDALWIFLLVFLAGFLNAAGFLRFGQTMSHMTGNLTKLGLAMSELDAGLIALFVVCVLSFLLGAAASSINFPADRPGIWKRCGLVFLPGGFLLVFSQALSASAFVSLAVLALALGAQNGLILRFRGVLARTTHITGHLTDCGAALGRMLAKKRFQGEDLRFFLFHLSCLIFFTLGVLVCALLSGALKINLLLLGGVFYLITGAAALARAKMARKKR